MNNILRSNPRLIDSHTGGEPTRTVVSGGPDLGTGTVAERRIKLQSEFDWFRSAVVNEPRGSDVIVGALLVPPCDASCVAGIIFFNNVGYLWMCGHGLIGVVTTLGWMGSIGAGVHRFETAVGVVEAEFDGHNRVRITNVPSRRSGHGISVDVPGFGMINGDVAWGGNWFFLTEDSPVPIQPSNIESLTNFARSIKQALACHKVTGDDGSEIDHIEIFWPPSDPINHSRNFVLCPGNAYDRSPCGTGTSAKVACLAADGKLKPGDVWRQESILGSVFEATYQIKDEAVVPNITGSAYVTADITMVVDPNDPFRFGIAA
jgi:4-hydroxyproline epimerase